MYGNVRMLQNNQLAFENIIVAEACGGIELVHGQASYNTSRIPYLGSRYYPGTMASFTCDDGYSLSGSESSICQASGDWDPIPTCGNDILFIFLFIHHIWDFPILNLKLD